MDGESGACCVIGQLGDGLGFGALAAQVAGLGLLWTSLHCAGMCGPLVASLRLGAAAERPGALAAAAGLVAYQGGRAVAYAALGALAGALGAGLAGIFQRGAVVVGLLASAGFLVAALWRLLAPRSVAAAAPGWVARAAGRVAALAAPEGAGLGALPRAALLGAVLSLMPCMLTFWVLTLAAASRSAWQGALLMLILVALTTPVLAISAALPALLARWRRRAGAWVAPTAMLFSSGWLLLVALAGAGVIAHRHVEVGRFTVMFW